ncbi:MAG: PBP1A family penicillin-binding protein [Xanthobacteraceae bacterium]
MDVILVKILAAFLALSQVATRPAAIKTEFVETRDQAEVVSLLRDGCAHMRKAFDIESIDLDGLIATALDDPQALTAEIKAFRGLNFGNLHLVYRQFCKNEDLPNSPVDIPQVIAYFNKAAANLPDHRKLKGLKLSGTSTVLDANGGRFAEVYEAQNRRVWVPLRDIPVTVRKAFVAAEDKRFYEHKGIDEHGLIRAMIANLARPGRPQGGSTITQQVVKNLLVGDDLTYERKIREMLLASRVEQTLSKDEILELYLNSIYLGRNNWGIELAARSFFGKPAAGLTLAEGATLAGMTKGPNYYSPDRHPGRAKDRLAYVLGRMQEDGAITSAQADQARNATLEVVPYERIQRTSGFYFLDHINREAKSLAGVAALTTASSTVRSTIHPDLQRATEAALQEGLARYELNTGRARFSGAEANLADAVKKIEADANAPKTKPAWQQALEAARLPLYDVHWPAAVVLQNGRKGGIKVGLADGRVVALNGASASVRRNLKLYDVVLVRLTERAATRKRAASTHASLRMRPQVQGAAVVLENRTGKILAMAGGFSYPLSQLNRTTQTQRQPGSALKPFTYLAALNKGLQPNTLVRDEPITLPPIGNEQSARESDYWSPKNYSNGYSGILTLRLGLEYSKNLVTAQLLSGAIDNDPVKSLARVCELTIEAEVYPDCVGYYPFVLGAQPVRLIDLAAFYAAIANEGFRPSPHAIEAVEQNGKVAFRHKPELKPLADGDRVAFVQLKSMLQGVVARGTANAIAKLAPYVAGKTGTSDRENDAWFVGFSNDVSIGVWVGYDNAGGKRRTLGGGQTGGKVAVPIFADIMNAVWADYAERKPLAPPSPEAKRRIIALPINLRSGDRVANGTPGAFTEYFRLDRTGRFDETQYNIVSQQEVATFAYNEPTDGETYGYPYGYGSGYGYGGGYGYPYNNRYSRSYPQPYQYQQQQQQYQQQQQQYQQQQQQQYQQQQQQQQQYYQRRGGLFGNLGRFFQPPRYRDYGNRESYPRRVDPQYPYAERERWW